MWDEIKCLMDKWKVLHLLTKNHAILYISTGKNLTAFDIKQMDVL